MSATVGMNDSCLTHHSSGPPAAAAELKRQASKNAFRSHESREERHHPGRPRAADMSKGFAEDLDHPASLF